MIIVIPCLLNAFFLLNLNKYWSEAALPVQRAEQRLGVLLTLNSSFASFVSYGFDLLTNTFRQNKIQEFESSGEKSEKTTSGEKVIVPPDAQQLLDSFKAVRANLDQLIEKLDVLDFHDNRSRFKGFSVVLKQACIVASNFEQYLHDQDSATERNWDTEQQVFTHAEAVIHAALGIELVLGLIFFLLFSLDVIRRLRILVDNAASLSKWAEQKRLFSGDELGYLDSVFKEVGEDLETVEQRCRQYTESVLERMDAPIEAIKAFFKSALESSRDLTPVDRAQILQWAESANRASSRILVSSAQLKSKKKSKKRDKTVDVDSNRFDLFVAVEDCIQELLPVSNAKEINLVNKCERGTLPYSSARITLVLMKYLVRALKDAPSGSEILINKVVKDNWISISIKDASEGLTQSEQKKVFESPVFGLAVCKTIIESMGGKYGVKSGLGEGSEYWFALPVVPKKQKALYTYDDYLNVAADPRHRNSNRFFQSSLFQKAALLVFLPLLAQLGFLFWMGQQIDTLKAVSQKLHHQEQLTLNVSRLWLHSFISTSSAALFLNTRRADYSNNAFAHIKAVDDLYPALQSKEDFSPDELILIKQSHAFTSSQSDLLKKAMQDESILGINGALAVLPAMFNRAAVVSGELNHLVGLETQKLQQITQDQLSLQDLGAKLIFAFIALNVIAVFFLVKLFAMTFSNRIAVLMIEARMLAQRQELPLSDVWSDEIDQVHGFLALASRSVIQADEVQKTSLNMAAHEISSPLETLDALFTIIESVPEAQANWSNQALQRARQSLEAAFAMVDELLAG